MSWHIRIQADDFFNAYKVLKNHNELIVGPSVVCLAFSLELYFKELHSVLKGKAPRGHDIIKLFEMLPSQIKQEIFAHDSIRQNPFNTRGNIFSPKLYDKAYTPYDRFVDQIKTISNGFKEWRYAHEKQILKYEESFALALIESVKSASDAARARSTWQVQD
tara:strand:- start:18068 stop:18553 length:486 start_codon:yes stop_codon:yes gene_type:complete